MGLSVRLWVCRCACGGARVGLFVMGNLFNTYASAYRFPMLIVQSLTAVPHAQNWGNNDIVLPCLLEMVASSALKHPPHHHYLWSTHHIISSSGIRSTSPTAQYSTHSCGTPTTASSALQHAVQHPQDTTH